MIARQRDNLRRTFAARQQESVSSDTFQRITTNQRELADATAELAAGLSQYGDVTPLENAATAMLQAIFALEGQDLDAAQFAEEEALTALIQARQNIRKLLKMSNGSSSSQCRKFDREQQQKLRTPDELKKQQEQQLAETREQICQLAEDQRKWSEDVRGSSKSSPMDQQDQPQRQSQDQQQQPPSSSSSSSSSSSASQSQQQQSQQQQSQQQQAGQQQSGQQQSGEQAPASLAEQQRQALERARQLSEQLEQSDQASDATRQRMEEAADAIQESLDQLADQQTGQAADQAQQVADQLQEVADHLAALNATDFNERLGHAQRMAQRLAERQQALSQQMSGGQKPGGQKPGGQKPGSQKPGGEQKPGGSQGTASGSEPETSGGGEQGSARESSRQPSSNGGSKQGSEQSGRDPNSVGTSEAQRALAATTDLLADLLGRLSTDAVEETQEARQLLDEVRAANPPADLARTMREAAAEFEAGKLSRAGESAGHAADGLRDLADGLQRARGRLSKPQLDELVALEKQVADLLAAVDRDAADSQALLQGQAEKLQREVESMAGRDQQLARTLQTMRQAAAEAASKAGQPSGSSPTTGQSQGETGPSQSTTGQSQGATGNGSGPSIDRPSDTGFGRSQQTLGDGLRQISRALQTRIQEAILAGVLQQSDDSVPPEYKDLVEQYYRELSDDLR